MNEKFKLDQIRTERKRLTAKLLQKISHELEVRDLSDVPTDRLALLALKLSESLEATLEQERDSF